MCEFCGAGCQMCVDADPDNCISCYASVFEDGVGPDNCVYGEENVDHWICAEGYTLVDDKFCFGDGSGSDETDDSDDDSDDNTEEEQDDGCHSTCATCSGSEADDCLTCDYENDKRVHVPNSDNDANLFTLPISFAFVNGIDWSEDAKILETLGAPGYAADNLYQIFALSFYTTHSGPYGVPEFWEAPMTYMWGKSFGETTHDDYRA